MTVQAIRRGDLFRNKYPELDGADTAEIGVNRYVNRDGVRWTPAGNVWVVTDMGGGPGTEYVTIVCHETGAAINPSPSELLDTDTFTRND